MTIGNEPVTGTLEHLLQVVQHEIIYRDMRTDSEAIDDLIIDFMAGELTTDGHNVAQVVAQYSDQLGEIYKLC